MSILKHIFYKLIAIFFTLITCPIHVSAVDFYAKVDFIPSFKLSGSTVLYHLLTGQKIDLNCYGSTSQITCKTKNIKINDKEVMIYFNDTIASHDCYGFYDNSNVVFYMINANDYVTREDSVNGYKAGCFIQNIEIEQNLKKFILKHPNCRVIVVLTQLQSIRESNIAKLIKEYISKNIIENEQIRDHIDGFFDLTLKGNDSDETRNNYTKSIFDTLKKSLSNCMEKNQLPNIPYRMTGMLYSETIVDQPEQKFLFFTIKEQRTHQQMKIKYNND